MKLAEREQALLALVEEYREQECQSLLEKAHQEAAELVRQAYRMERRQLHKRVVAERARARARIQAAEAERTTRQRRASEKICLSLLEAAWPRLRERLLARWQRPVTRRQWVQRHLGDALRLLPRNTWVIHHASDWPREERQTLSDRLAKELGRTPQWRADASIGAGFRIDGGGAGLDATLEGLLADKVQLEARLLALLGVERTI